MKIKYEVKTLDDWKKYFPPAGGDSQWRDGYSAKELAKIVLDYYKDVKFEEELKKVFHHNFSLIPEDVYPEHLSQFDNDWHGPRHHDLACIGNLDGKKIALCFEAKVFESLDVRLRSYAGNSNGRTLRRDKLCSILFKSDYSHEKFGKIYYQLMSSIAGTVAFAAENKLEDAYFIVYQIIPAKNNDELEIKNKKIKSHKDALIDFLHCMNIDVKNIKSGSIIHLGEIQIEREKDNKKMAANVHLVYVEQNVSGERLD